MKTLSFQALRLTLFKSFKGLTNLSLNEQIWACLFFFFSGLGVIVANNLFEFHHNPEFNSLTMSSMNDCFIVFPVAIFTWIYRDVFTYCFRQKLEDCIDKTAYPTKIERRDRSLVLCKWVLDFLYYSFAWITTFLIMKDANFFPRALLGKGDISLIKTGKFPAVEVPLYLKEMYCVQLGYHLYSITHQILMKRGEKKFMEYLLHHGLTILLITYSYGTNFINNGSITLLVHDISDAALVFARSYAYMSFKNEKLSGVTYFSAVGIWIYMRLFVLPIYGIYPVWQILFGIEGKYRELFEVMTIYMLAMVSVLQVMHVYWTYFMLKALTGYIYGNKMKADYNLTETKLRKKL